MGLFREEVVIVEKKVETRNRVSKKDILMVLWKRL